MAFQLVFIALFRRGGCGRGDAQRKDKLKFEQPPSCPVEIHTQECGMRDQVRNALAVGLADKLKYVSILSHILDLISPNI